MAKGKKEVAMLGARANELLKAKENNEHTWIFGDCIR
jgi:hypothetical protein